MANIEKRRKEEIVQLHGKFAKSFKRTLDYGIRIGQLLTEQKADLKHGEFGLWIERSVPFSSRTARNYMKLFRNRDALKTETVSDFKSAYKLLDMQISGELDRGIPSSRILPVHGSRGMAKGRLRSYGLRKTRMRGISFGRGGDQVLKDRKI